MKRDAVQCEHSSLPSVLGGAGAGGECSSFLSRRGAPAASSPGGATSDLPALEEPMAVLGKGAISHLFGSDYR